MFKKEKPLNRKLLSLSRSDYRTILCVVFAACGIPRSPSAPPWHPLPLGPISTHFPLFMLPGMARVWKHMFWQCYRCVPGPMSQVSVPNTSPPPTHPPPPLGFWQRMLSGRRRWRWRWRWSGMGGMQSIFILHFGCAEKLKRMFARNSLCCRYRCC